MTTLLDQHPELARYISEREWFSFLREQTAALAEEIPEMQLQMKTLDSLLEMYNRILSAEIGRASCRERV